MSDIKRHAYAEWSGDLKGGRGKITTETGVLSDTPYSFRTRFEDEKQGTNPEELIAAASASCFSMAFAKMLSEGGNTPDRIQTRATMTMRKVEGGFKLAGIHLETRVKAPGMDAAKFQETAEKAKNGCPVSQLLKPGLDELTLDASLDG